MIAALKILALVMAVGGGWAVLATIVTPPLTSGWREGLEAVMRRWTLAAMVLVPGAVVLMGIWGMVARFWA